MKRNLIAVGVAAILATAGVAAYAHGNGQHQGCTPSEGKECPAGAKAEHQHGGMQGRMQGMQGNHGNMEANHARMAERHAQMAARHGGMQHGGMQGGMRGGQPPAASDDSKQGEHKH